jgi:serine/threonine protein kinase
MLQVEDLPISIPRSRIPDDATGLGASGKYHPEALLGEGAAGSVYLSHRFRDSDDLVPHLFAIKILSPLQQIARTERDLHRIAARFRAEALRGRQLGHPHLVKITDYGYIHGGSKPWDGAPFYAMPFIEGDTLNTLFNNPAPPMHELHRWAIELTDAVAYLHSLDLCHRDIKPHNILITKGSRQLLLGDFGVIRWGDYMPEYTDGILTYSSEILTTWQYLPPEVEHTPSFYDASSDAWSLGKTLLELFSWQTIRRIAILEGYKQFTRGKPPVLMGIIEELIERESCKRPTVRDVLSNFVAWEQKIIKHIELVKGMGGVAAKNITNISGSMRALYYSNLCFLSSDNWAKWEKRARCRACGSSYMVSLGTWPVPEIDYGEDYWYYVCAGTEDHPCGELISWCTEDGPPW